MTCDYSNRTGRRTSHSMRRLHSGRADDCIHGRRGRRKDRGKDAPRRATAVTRVFLAVATSVSTGRWSPLLLLLLLCCLRERRATDQHQLNTTRRTRDEDVVQSQFFSEQTGQAGKAVLPRLSSTTDGCGWGVDVQVCGMREATTDAGNGAMWRGERKESRRIRPGSGQVSNS